MTNTFATDISFTIAATTSGADPYARAGIGTAANTIDALAVRHAAC